MGSMVDALFGGQSQIRPAHPPEMVLVVRQSPPLAGTSQVEVVPAPDRANHQSMPAVAGGQQGVSTWSFAKTSV